MKCKKSCIVGPNLNFSAMLVEETTHIQDLEELPDLITKFSKNLRVFILDSVDKIFTQKVAKV
jgi:hypothetical protein